MVLSQGFQPDLKTLERLVLALVALDQVITTSGAFLSCVLMIFKETISSISYEGPRSPVCHMVCTLQL